MNDTVKGTLVGEPVEAPVATTPPKTRAERIQDWRNANREAYRCAKNAYECTCTPTRAQMILLEQWSSPPVD
jgi:hypothetical protein